MSLEKNRSLTEKIVVTAILAAIIVVLQTFASSIKIGPFSITLSLVPIMIGAILYGSAVGAILGAVFGAVVCVSVVTGVDVGGFIMFQKLPVLTLFLCLLKSTVAGFASGEVYKAFKKLKLFSGKGNPGVILAAIVCPVCNTGILCVGIFAFYRDIAIGWANSNGYDSLLLYILVGMVGINFLMELLINIVLVPVIVRVVKAVKKVHS